MNAREEVWGYVAPRKPKGTRKVVRAAQGSFAHVRTWGGPRAGSGRKKAERGNVRHRTRAVHRGYQPLHITLRSAKGLPSFRSERLAGLIRKAIGHSQRDGFRIAEYSIQDDHIHMLVEAQDSAQLTRGMRSFTVRVAMRVNRTIFQRRRGRVWGDRYHRRDLTNPTEVRRALVYVLKNHTKHGHREVGHIDPCSSGPWFSGWMQIIVPPPEPGATAPPQTWLLREGWTTVGYGLLHVGELPKAARA